MKNTLMKVELMKISIELKEMKVMNYDEVLENI